MSSIEQLFALGYVTDTVDIEGVKFTLSVLDSRRSADALNAAVGEAEQTAQKLSYRLQVLARAITAINGQSQFVNPNLPTPEEIQKSLNLLERIHYNYIFKLYDAYVKLDDSVNKEIEENVKK